MSPSAPRKPCRFPSCGILVGNGAYCEKHLIKKEVEIKEQRIKYDNERGTAHSRGYGSRWARYSKQYRVDHPLCVLCEKKGILTVAQCVDHIEAVSDKDDPKFWLESNHQSLCNSCHSEKTAKEDAGFGNQRKDRFL